MALDFSGLRKISVPLPEATRTFPEPHGNSSEGIDKLVVPILIPQVGTRRTYLKVEKEKQDWDNAYRVYQEYLANKIKSELLKDDITKDITNGRDPYPLLLKALECIASLTGDPSFYSSNRDKLQTIHGALNRPDALEDELREVVRRLKLLEKAYEKGPTPAVNGAITAHRKTRDNLVEKLCPEDT